MDGAYYRELLRPHFSGRRCVLFGVHLRGAMARARLLRELGASDVLLLAFTEGTGPDPDPEICQWLDLGLEAPDPVAEFRLMEKTLAAPPVELVETLERFDPDRTATVYLPPIFLSSPPREFLGRRLYGVRPPEWLTFEDKTAVDALWDGLGVQRPPSAVVAPPDAASAAARLDRGSGTVWAGDSREGVHGGSALVRWIRPGMTPDEEAAFFATHCDRVRVTPFLEGVPCSIHAWVFGDYVAVFRPVEMMTLRPATGSAFRYAGCATYYDPPEPIRDQMRNLARRVGADLRDRTGFRGVLTIDGVAGEDGFMATELNPRYGAGMNTFTVPDLPMAMLAQACTEGEELDYRPADLERLILDYADAHRGGGAWTVLDTRHEVQTTRPLLWNVDAYELADGSVEADATLLVGPGAAGGFVRFTPEPERTPAGPSLAPRAVAAFALADHEMGTGLGKLAAARDVHSS